MTHSGGITLEPKWCQEQEYQRQLLSKRLNENKADLFKEVILNSGMSLRKRQKVETTAAAD